MCVGMAPLSTLNGKHQIRLTQDFLRRELLRAVTRYGRLNQKVRVNAVALSKKLREELFQSEVALLDLSLKYYAAKTAEQRFLKNQRKTNARHP